MLKIKLFWHLNCILMLNGIIWNKTVLTFNSEFCPIGWGCRIHRLHFRRGVRHPPNKYPGYDTKQSDGEVPAVLKLWGMWSTPSLPSLPGTFWPRVVAPDKGPIYGLNRTKRWFEFTALTLKLHTYAKLNCLK